MNSRRFAGIFFAIFVLGAMPLLLVQPMGDGSAGLSAGFMAPLNILYLFILLLIGLWANWLGKEATVMLPITFITMVAIAGLLSLNPTEVPHYRFAMFGAILLFALSIATSYSRAFIVSASITSSIAFHLGISFSNNVPDLASPLYYLLGLLISTSLLLATGVALGLTLVEEFARLKEKLRAIPGLSGFFALF